MSRYQEELLALAQEIAATEGLSLPAALDRAAMELRPLVVYGHDWDKRAAEKQWALLTVTHSA